MDFNEASSDLGSTYLFNCLSYDSVYRFYMNQLDYHISTTMMPLAIRMWDLNETMDSS